MALSLKSFVRKPFNVQAVEVTRDNMAEVAAWCKGQVRTAAGTNEDGSAKKYIKVSVKRPLDERQTKAYIGDYVVMATDPNIRGFKVYTPRAFDQTYDELVADMERVLGNMAKRAGEEDRYEEEGLGFAEELQQNARRG